MQRSVLERHVLIKKNHILYDGENKETQQQKNQNCDSSYLAKEEGYNI